jgi:hypothetical protein
MTILQYSKDLACGGQFVVDISKKIRSSIRTKTRGIAIGSSAKRKAGRPAVLCRPHDLLFHCTLGEKDQTLALGPSHKARSWVNLAFHGRECASTLSYLSRSCEQSPNNHSEPRAEGNGNRKLTSASVVLSFHRAHPLRTVMSTMESEFKPLLCMRPHEDTVLIEILTS